MKFEDQVAKRVLSFYQELPFNIRDSVMEAARHVRSHDPVQTYTPLQENFKDRRILEVGCGVGWFSNGMSYHHDATVVGIDFNPVAIDRANATAAELGISTQFEVQDLFEFQPKERFQLVVSLGVLHHTPNCDLAIRRLCREFLDVSGMLLIGLYHSYGRKPFLQHFRMMQDSGASEDQMLLEYGRLHNIVDDVTHLRSWFRDQVLHPHETQHTYCEVRRILEAEGLSIFSTSINRFAQIESHEAIEREELNCESISVQALHEGRYYPGFFVVAARR